MQLKEQNSELVKSETFAYIYKKILEGRIKDLQLIDLVFKYFYGNPQQLFQLHYQSVEPTRNPHKNKVCYSCGNKGHIKRSCNLQGLTEEEEIEFVFQKHRPVREELIKKEVLIFFKEVLSECEDIPDDIPYEEDPYED